MRSTFASPVLKQARNWRRFQMLLAASLWPFASAVQAQVIEIGDDGEARVYEGPTLFLGDEGSQPVGSLLPSASMPANAFERAAKIHNLDVRLLRAVAWTESRGRNDALSPKGARGIMQLMPGTAAELGVDPRDPESNISGGAAYLAQQINRFRTVPLALAAYNAGPGAVQRWGGVPPYAETRNYVRSVIQRWGGKVARPVPISPLPSASPASLTREGNALLIEVP